MANLDLLTTQDDPERQKTMTTNFTQYIDLAQVVLYLFIAFFLALVYYLHRENKREGYPLESERSGLVSVQGFPPVPSPKTFHLADGSSVQAPRANPHDSRPVNASPAAGFPGAPLVPHGDPMTAGVGPGAYADRLDIPDVTVHGTPKLVPLRIAKGFYVDPEDPNPIGMTVVGADGKSGGVVRDVWVDQGEYLIRYFEVETGDAGKKRNVLLPTTLARVVGEAREVRVKSILGHQFASVPTQKKPDMVTRLEEEKIFGFYGAGTLYATPQRSEPLL
jgi:photosynthetic reaction center H subunit